LGRIIRLIDGEQHSLIRAKWLTKVFVGGGVLSFLAQSGGMSSIQVLKSQATIQKSINFQVVAC
jgi:hypothetical protein